MSNKLEQLKSMSVVVADTGEFNAIKTYQPEDATTNPSLLYKVAQNSEYTDFILEAIEWAKQQPGDETIRLHHTLQKFAVNIGTEILKVIPGRVSTEVDARLSFHTEETIRQAQQLITLYQQAGIDKERVLIKIASTWEGICAAEQLEKQGIHCNLTLLFNFTQALACAEAGATLISPFVGRILDWHKNHTGRDHYAPMDDPGVLSVTQIYQYYKQYGYDTIVMGASFRNTGEIEQLAGCDRLTISPQLMQELQQDKGKLERKLCSSGGGSIPRHAPVTESLFRWELNQDAMATEKLAEGIRNFAVDQNKLETLILGMDEYHASQHKAVL
ncbi:MAG: transaldolase [Pseudomonadales bacterium]|nr:transaldolase [Pseudomonadales bacterium]